LNLAAILSENLLQELLGKKSENQQLDDIAAQKRAKGRRQEDIL
jgi:hypothetical protein